MTPEERARKVHQEMDWIDRHVKLYPEDAEEDIARIAAAIRAAVAQEREECARLLESRCAEVLAAAIRARKG